MNIIGKFMLIRTVNAGVHMGTVLAISQDGLVVDLSNSRRLWRWEGAFSLSEIANNGCAESSRISEVVEFNQLSQVIEKLLCTPKAEANLTRTRNNV